MFGLVADNCPVCGKEFFPKYGWVYKREGIKYCSWKCLRRATKDEKKPDLNDEDAFKIKSGRTSRRIQQLDADRNFIDSFKSAKEASNAINGVVENIRQACRSGKLYKGYYWRYGE